MSQEISAWDPSPSHAAAPAAQGREAIVSLCCRNWPVLVLLLYFAGRLLFFAVGITPFVPPDEVTHFGKCVAFSKALLLPDNSPASYEFGLVTNIAWLYYFVMGKLLLLNFFGIPDLTYLRLCNIPMVFGAVWYAFRMLRLLTRDRLAGVLLAVLMTNTLMFTFVSASVSYDNLTNLLGAAALFYLFSFLKERSGTHLALSLLCQLAGCLTKNTFLPLFLIMNILLLAHEWRRLPQLPRALSGFLRSSGRGGFFLAGGIVLGVLLNLQLYGGNLLRYHRLEVETYHVLPFEHAMKYRLAARSYIVDQFIEGRISVEKAQELSALVNNAGDRRDTMTLVRRYADVEERGEPVMGFLPYTASWMLLMLDGTFGIKAHLGMANRGLSFVPIALFTLAALAAFLLRWRPREGGYLPACMALAAAGYALFLLYKVNYATYLVYKDPFFTIAGRYMFPVLAPVYVLASCYLMRLFKGESARLALLAAGALAFIVADFPFFLSNAGPEWFASALP